MEYAEEFERDFMKRTLSLVQTYTGPHDATLLLNCLLGLLIVPKETALERIPTEPIASLANWGISPSSISVIAKQTNRNNQPDTLRGVVHSLRNSVAHFRFKPIHKNGTVEAFRFTDLSGFDATIPLEEMRQFVERLAKHLHES